MNDNDSVREQAFPISNGMNVTLIGMAGAGKTENGKALATKLGIRFVDVDDLMEAAVGKSIHDILDRDGEAEYLRIEEEAALTLEDADNAVIAPGGSVVYCGRAMELLGRLSIIVFIDVPFAVIEERLGRNARPVIGARGRTLREVYEERMPLYLRYAYCIVAAEGGESPDVVAERIAETLSAQKEKSGYSGLRALT